MDLLSWILVTLVLICSIPCGYLLGWIAQEELASLEKTIVFTFRVLLVCFGASLALYFIYAHSFLLYLALACIFLLGMIRGSFSFLK